MKKLIGKIALVVLLLGIVALNVFFMGVSGQEKISQKQAENMAPSEISGKVTESEFDDGAYELEVDENGVEREVKVDPLTGKIFDVDEEDENEEVVPVEVLAQYPNKITESRAKEIALREKSGNIVNVKIEKENGKLIYEVEIKSGSNNWEVEVDGETGEILEVEEDD